MEEILTGEPTAEEVAQMQKVIRQHFAEIERLRERMRRDQTQIEASGMRTDAMLREIQMQLTKLQAS